jgi:hypothetical protein
MRTATLPQPLSDLRVLCLRTGTLTGLLLLALVVTSCRPHPKSYASYGFSVTFPDTFEVRSSEEDTPLGKVHKTGAVCQRRGCDLAFFTTTYPEALVKPYSDNQVLKKELDMSLKRMDATLSSVQTNLAFAIPCIGFTFEVPKESRCHGECLLFYKSNRTFLISALYVERTPEIAGFFNSLALPTPAAPR